MPLMLHLIDGEFAVCRLAPNEPVPVWADSAVFSSITRTADELSLICPAATVPVGVKTEAGWRLLKLQGPFDFAAVGILSAVLAPLAASGISSLAIATFDTDYVLVKTARLEEALRTLAAAGHIVRRA